MNQTNVLQISKKRLKVFGSESLLGKIFSSGFTKAHPLRIEFEQGVKPEMVEIPDYVPMCLLRDVTRLRNEGWKIEIGEYT